MKGAGGTRKRGRPPKVRGLLWGILKAGKGRVGRPRGDLMRGDLVRLAYDVALYRKDEHERRNHRGGPPGLSAACRRRAKAYARWARGGARAPADHAPPRGGVPLGGGGGCFVRLPPRGRPPPPDPLERGEE